VEENMKIGSRKVVEIKQRLSSFINKRIFVANELRNVDIEIEPVEKLDGLKPHIIVRVKSIKRNLSSLKPRPQKAPLPLSRSALADKSLGRAQKQTGRR
jgi:hypothetical protein